MVNITSNGSKWAGEEPDTIEKLKEMLKTQTLDATFEKYGNFCYKTKNKREWTLFGNFLTYSHVFNITTDEEPLVKEIKKLINANKKREDYKRGNMITRKEYMENSKVLHRKYFAQFVDDAIKNNVLQYIGESKLKESKDEYLNDIPLYLWDNLTGFKFRGSEMISKPLFIRKELQDKLKEAGEGISCAVLVCIYKEAAKQIKETL